MAYSVTIKYSGVPTPPSIPFVSPICGLYYPTNSYTETTAYEGTVYDTNTSGFGAIDLMEPYASTSFPFPVPLAQFKLAVIGEDGTADDAGKKVVTFTVDTYSEAFWYMEAGKALAEQGFEVSVEEAQDGNDNAGTG